MKTITVKCAQCFSPVSFRKRVLRRVVNGAVTSPTSSVDPFTAAAAAAAALARIRSINSTCRRLMMNVYSRPDAD